MAGVRIYTEEDMQERLAEQRQMCAIEARKSAIAVKRLSAFDIDYIEVQVLNATGDE